VPRPIPLLPGLLCDQGCSPLPSRLGCGHHDRPLSLSDLEPAREVGGFLDQTNRRPRSLRLLQRHQCPLGFPVPCHMAGAVRGFPGGVETYRGPGAQLLVGSRTDGPVGTGQSPARLAASWAAGCCQLLERGDSRLYGVEWCGALMLGDGHQDRAHIGALVADVSAGSSSQLSASGRSRAPGVVHWHRWPPACRQGEETRTHEGCGRCLHRLQRADS